LWPCRQVTQRLIYFTVGRPPFLLPRLLRRSSSLPRQCVALTRAKGPAADIVPRTRAVSRLYTRLQRIYMKKESPRLFLFPSRGASSSQPPEEISRAPAPVKLDEAPLPCRRAAPRWGCPQCKHGSSLSPGSLYFKKYSSLAFSDRPSRIALNASSSSTVLRFPSEQPDTDLASVNVARE